MNDLAATIFSTLRSMDEEASSRCNDLATGLYWYAGHVCPTKPRNTERSWTRELASRLRNKGCAVEEEKPYPSMRRKKCDLVITLPNAGELWLEVKGAWKEWWAVNGGLYIYRSYLLHPLVAGLDETKRHTAAFDVQRLASLPATVGRGLLLVGFDSIRRPMDSDITELVRLAGLGESPWQSYQREWDDPYREGERVRCWLWANP